MKETFYRRLNRVYDNFKRKHSITASVSLSTIILGSKDLAAFREYQIYKTEGNRCTFFEHTILKKNKKYFIGFKI